MKAEGGAESKSAGQHQGAAMKKGWQTKQLGELCRFIDYRGKTPEKTASGLRLITAKNVKMGYLQENPMEFVAPESYDSWMTRGIPKMGDVLFTTEAPLANVAQLDTDEKVVFAQRIIVLQPAANNLDRTFLKYLLLSDVAQDRILEQGTGATVQGIKASLLKTIPIEFPPLAEQQRIVGLLDEAFEGLATAKANAEKNLQNARALFESHLRSVFTQRGPGWVEKNLGDLCQIKTGKKDVNEGNPDGKYPFFTCAAAHTFSDNYSFDTEALLVAGNGNVGQVSYYSGKFEAYQRTYVLFDFKGVTAKYLFRVLDKRLSATVSKQKLGNTMPYIKIGMLTDFVVPVPPPKEQELVAESLRAISEETQNLARLYEQKLVALDALKKSLLHQAFAGEL